MTAGLIQLSFSGPQDDYLTGNPQMTYFKSIYRSYSNFAKDIQKLQFENNVKFNSTHSCIIKNYGDLLSNLYLYVELPQLVSTNNNENWAGYVNGVGFSLIESVSFEIGGQTIDTFDYNWLDIYNELYDQTSDSLVSKFNTDISVEENNYAQKLYIPLHFWFSKNYGNALPLIALEYHEIKVNVTFRKIEEIIKSDISNFSYETPNLNAYIIANYIHLDETEKRFFSNNKLEYLMEQTQILSTTDIQSKNSARVALNFSHPIKSIYWIICNDINTNPNMKTGNNWLSYTSNNSLYSETFNTARITINGQDRITDMDASYYRSVIPYETRLYSPRKYIYTYSFSLHPTQNQPSGSCNYSKIGNSRSYLELTFNPINTVGGTTNGKIKVYAQNYNIFKVESGMGNVIFAN
jgi:hypothetical protein